MSKADNLPFQFAARKTKSTQAGIQSVEVGFALLQALAKHRGAMMLRDLAQACGMSPAKAHRYLVSYQRLGLVMQDGMSTKYDLGPAALQLGLAALSRLDAVQLARERMDELLEVIGHTVAIAVWGNHGPTIVHWREPARAVTVNLRLGDVMPLLSSATGRCFAAHLPLAQIKHLIDAELAQINTKSHRNTDWNTDIPRNARQVAALLARTREQGLGRVEGCLLPGISGLAAPVMDADGRICLSLVTLGASASFDASVDGILARTLKACAARLSADLGYI